VGHPLINGSIVQTRTELLTAFLSPLPLSSSLSSRLDHNPNCGGGDGVRQV
jgi:hypothetical protein